MKFIPQRSGPDCNGSGKIPTPTERMARAERAIADQDGVNRGFSGVIDAHRKEIDELKERLVALDKKTADAESRLDSNIEGHGILNARMHRIEEHLAALERANKDQIQTNYQTAEVIGKLRCGLETAEKVLSCQCERLCGGDCAPHDGIDITISRAGEVHSASVLDPASALSVCEVILKSMDDYEEHPGCKLGLEGEAELEKSSRFPAGFDEVMRAMGYERIVSLPCNGDCASCGCNDGDTCTNGEQTIGDALKGWPEMLVDCRKLYVLMKMRNLLKHWLDVGLITGPMADRAGALGNEFHDLKRLEEEGSQ